MSGAKRVERVSIETSKATSPPERKAITLDEVPLGQEPTRITPAAVAPFRWKIIQSNQAKPGTMT